jgi:hypothetical protein
MWKALLALGTLLLIVPAAFAGNGAIRVYEDGCEVLDGMGNIVFLGPDSSLVTPSGNGIITCRGIAPNQTGRAVHWNVNNVPLACFVAGVGSTGDWHETLSASGRATLVCKFHH